MLQSPQISQQSHSRTKRQIRAEPILEEAPNFPPGPNFSSAVKTAVRRPIHSAEGRSGGEAAATKLPSVARLILLGLQPWKPETVVRDRGDKEGAGLGCSLRSGRVGR